MTATLSSRPDWRGLEYLTTYEVAEVIRRQPDYVRRQCESGALRATKLGNAWRIRPVDLDEFMAAGTKAPATRPYRRRAS